MLARAFDWIVVASFLLGPLASAVPSPHVRTIAPHELKAQPLTRLFAATCSAEHWETFAAWAKRARFSQWENSEKLEIKTTKDSIAESTTGFQFRYLHDGSRTPYQGEWQGRTVRASDGCELLTNLLAKSSAKDARWALALPQAQAQIMSGARVSEDSDGDRKMIVGAVIGLGLTAALAWPALAAGLTIEGAITATAMAYELYSDSTDGVRSYQALELKKAFERLMNADLRLECSAGVTVIHSGTQKIVVRKSWTYTMDVFDEKTGFPVYSDHDLKAVPKSREFITNVARKCDTPEQAQALTAQFSSELNAVNDKVESLAAASSTKAPSTDVTH